MTAPDSAVAAQIVEAAQEHFLRFGYSQASTERIARSIGRSKKTLYKHFPSKEALLHAVLARLAGEAERELGVLLAERGGDRPARLRGILTAVALRMAGSQQVLLADLRTSSPALGQQAWRERRQALRRLLEPVLTEAVTERVLRADLQIGAVLDIFLSCVEGLASPSLTEDDAQPSIEVLVGLLVDGLRAR